METRWSLWWLLLGVAAACLVYLAAAPSPWTDGLDTSLEAKESIRTRSWVIMGLWYGAAINLALAILALLAWHFRPEMVEGSGLVAESDPPADSRAGRWLRTSLVIFATGAAAWAMLPRLDLSLWGDEDATARRFIIGQVYRGDSDDFTVKPPSWQKTIWNWDTGTNSHLLFNVLSRLSHGGADVSGKHPGRFYFSERRIRMPSFVTTLLLIPAAAWLVTLLGFPRGAPLTSFLLALHPWVIRYGSDARGYALQMLLGALTMACLIEALKRPGRVRWWLAFGLGECLLLLSHFTSIYFLFPLNVAALWLAWAPLRQGRRNPLRVATVWRYAGATLLGTMLSIQILMPIVLQMPGYFARGRLTGTLDSALIGDSLAYWALGAPWHPWEPGNPLAITWHDLRETHPIATMWAAALIGLFFLIGIGALARRSGHRWWLLPLLTPVPLLFFDAWRSGNLLYPWYSIGFLPLGFVVVGVGFCAAAPSAPRWPRPLAALVPLVTGLLLLSLFAIVTDRQREIIRHHAVEPLADSVRVTREVVNPFHPRIDESLTLGFVHASRLYDPAMTLATSDEEFVAAIRDAEKRKRPLWVNAANIGIATSNFPLASALVKDRDVFEEPLVVHGLQQPCTRYVFRYRPGGLERFESRQTAHPPSNP